MDAILKNYELIGAYMHHEAEGKRFIGYRFKNLSVSTRAADSVLEYFEEIPFGASPLDFITARDKTHSALVGMLKRDAQW